MWRNYRTFLSINIMILLSTLCILGMYTYSINTSLNTVRTNIQDANLNKIEFTVNNLDRNLERLNMLAVSVYKDRLVSLLPSIDSMDSYERVMLIKDLTEKLNYQSLSEGWSNHISIWSPYLKEWIGSPVVLRSSPPTRTDSDWLMDSYSNLFVKEKSEKDYVISVTFPANNMKQLLDSAKQEGKNDPFFYQAEMPLILNSSSNIGKVHKLMGNLANRLKDHAGTEFIILDGTTYMVNYMKSEYLGWYMIDYLPQEVALKPIKTTQNWFYLSCIALFAGGIITAFSLFRKVQIPILELLKGVRMIKAGDFSARIQHASNNEFDALYANFNSMAEQIEELIDKVYKEKIVSREALLKQLQAQINPHFLYNCLFFINSSARLGYEDAVVSMSQNLGEYFRYTTRLEEPMTTLQKEIAIVEKYLTIQQLRMDRLHYEIQIPESMNSLVIPKLLIQPLAENSVIHGIEKKQTAGFIKITGTEEETGYRLTVEDDGKGLSEEEIETLKLRISQPLSETMGCALWNINQRLGIYFAAPTEMEFNRSPLGGLAVTLYWSKPVGEKEGD